jgi:hypothetical protein
MSWAVSAPPISVSAKVDEQLELSVRIRQVQDDQDPGTEGTDVTTMQFGPLTDTFADGSKAGNLFSRTWFCVFLIPNTSSRPYIVKQTATSLTDGANSIPDNTYLMVPDYRQEDEWVWGPNAKDRAPQGPMPSGASLGSAGSAVGTDIPIFTSEPAGKSHIIRAYYTITNGFKADGTTWSTWSGFSGNGIPLDHPAGNYGGTVTFSLVLQ